MISAVIPVFNEAESLRLLHKELTGVAARHEYDLEIVLVDDGSTDESWRIIDELSRSDARVRGIRFRRNFGKAAALTAGFQAARGDIVFTLDADLQDDPKEIPRFLAEIDAGLDVVSGWKQTRHDPWHKVGPSRIFNWLIGALTGVKLHDHNCGFKCYRRGVVNEVRLYGEMHRFVPVLAAARGWKVGEIVVEHRARKFGRSKYGFTRFVKGFLDLLTVVFLTGYGQRPQHLLGTIGLGAFSIGSLGMVSLAVYWIAAQLYPSWELKPLHQRPAVIYSAGLMLLGAQFMCTGFLAELITANTLRSQDTFSVCERTGGSSDASTEMSAGATADNPRRTADETESDGTA